MVKKILDQWEIATHPTAIQGLACFGWINSFWAEVWRRTLNSHISIDFLSEISLQVLWTYKVFIQKMLKITSWVDSEKIHVPERRQRVPRAIIDVDGDTSPNRPAIKPLHRQTPWLFFHDSSVEDGALDKIWEGWTERPLERLKHEHFGSSCVLSQL